MDDLMEIDRLTAHFWMFYSKEYIVKDKDRGLLPTRLCSAMCT